MEEPTVNIRSIQHFMYCPRRFGLLEINNDWSENAFVVKANIMHENVHSGDHSFSNQKKLVVSAVTVYNDEPQYNLYGVTDCIEFERNKKAAFIPQLGDCFNVKIVEYKPKPPKIGDYHESDAIQVFAQKLCVDYIYKCSCECYIYYSDTRKRVKLPFDEKFEEYDIQLKEYLTGMRKILESEIIPPKRKGQKCSGCSLSDVCFPKKQTNSVKAEIMSMKTIGGEV